MGVSSTRLAHFNPKPAFRMQGPRPPDGHPAIVPNQAPLIAVVDSAGQFGTSASCGDVYRLRILREQSRSSQKWIQCCCVGDDTIPRSWSAEVENGHRVLHDPQALWSVSHTNSSSVATLSGITDGLVLARMDTSLICRDYCL